MAPNLLVYYDPDAGYMSGKGEVHAILTDLGDQKAEQELVVPGVIGVSTVLKARSVVEEARELFLAEPLSFTCTIKWVPVDFWCNATIDEIKAVVKEEIKDMIVSDDLYSIEIVKHRSELHEEQIIEAVTPMLRGKVSLDHPQKILRIELCDTKASVTLLRPENVFSIIKEK